MPPKTPKIPAPLPGDDPQLQGDAALQPSEQANQDAAMAAAAAALAAEQPPATDPPEPELQVSVDIPAAPVPDSVPVRVLHRLRRDRKLYGPGQPNGDELTLGSDDARELVAAGAVELI